MLIRPAKQEVISDLSSLITSIHVRSCEKKQTKKKKPFNDSGICQEQNPEV